MTKEDKGFMIDMTIPGVKEAVAMAVLQSRLKMAIHFKRTDAFALQSARNWAARFEHPNPNFKTMKQAKAWVDSVVENIHREMAEAEARREAQGPGQGPSGEPLI